MRIYLILIMASTLSYACNSDVTCQEADPFNDCKAHSIYVPRQLSYNPIYENALTFNRSLESRDWSYIFAVKPIYNQTVGCKLKRYFNIDHESEVLVDEFGTGDVNSSWFQVIDWTTRGVPYSSTLRFCPVKRTYGAMLYFEMDLPCNFWFSINTAAVRSTTNMNLVESDIIIPGTVPGFATMKESFASSQRLFGKICGKQHKSGVDDVQLKLIKLLVDKECFFWDIYGLVGIPTGSGSKAKYLFEPLVGSKHAQIGLGTNFQKNLHYYDCGNISFQGEIKWRYGLRSSEYRTFDLAENGEWSRHLLFAPEHDKYVPFFASDLLTYKASVAPRNSLDVYLALHGNRNKWQWEVGYDFWFRQQENVYIKNCDKKTDKVGIIYAPSYSLFTPTTVLPNTNISQSFITSSPNYAISESTFTTIDINAVNLESASQPKSMSNSIYFSVGYNGHYGCTPTLVGLNVSYERGHNINSPDSFSVWGNIDFYL